MSKPKLIIMVGNIVSGKTTWITNFLVGYSTKERNNWAVLSKDALRVMIGAGRYVYEESIEPIIHISLLNLMQNFMVEGINVILDETNMDKDTRREFHCLADSYGYETIAVVLSNPPQEEIIKRIGCRKGKLEWVSTSTEVWEGVWERKNSKFEMPTEEEGFDEIWEVFNE